MLYNILMEKLVKNLIQKDENKALSSAANIINTKNVQAFELLCQKSDFLFDFVKNNVCKRIRNVVTKENYKNLLTFFSIYDENYADTIISCLAKYANEDLTDEIYEFLENGSTNEQKYAAKYFSYIPDTIAQEKLEKYAFSNDTQLAANCAIALSKMDDSISYDKAIALLKSNDDFEKVKAVRFLTSYGNKSAVKDILPILDEAGMSENIAGEVPYLMPIIEMIETQDRDLVLRCIDYILLAIGEILPNSLVFDFELYEVINYLINEVKLTKNSHISLVLLRALDKFNTLTGNDEYIFDETKDTKEEIQEIAKLLNSQDNAFWNTQKDLLKNELFQSKTRSMAALEIIKSLKIQNTESVVLDLINVLSDEQELVLALSTAKTLGLTDKISKNITEKISDKTLKAVAESYFN